MDKTKERYEYKMNATEIILLILGFLSISISFFLGSKEETGEQSEAAPEGRARDVCTEKEEAMVKERIHSILEEEKDDVLAVTTDLLNRKSNEKIIEFDEFAKPLLEKIHHNHEEVVFMYNMLTQKEKEWKEAAKRPVKIASESSAEPMPAEAPQKKVPQARESERQLPVSKKPEVAPEKPKEKAPVKKVQKKIPKAVAEPTEEAVSAEDSVPAAAKKIDEVNKKIVSLHKQGKSVLDISKELNIGQGEVKLTIALYGGNK